MMRPHGDRVRGRGCGGRAEPGEPAGRPGHRAGLGRESVPREGDSGHVGGGDEHWEGCCVWR